MVVPTKPSSQPSRDSVAWESPFHSWPHSGSEFRLICSKRDQETLKKAIPAWKGCKAVWGRDGISREEGSLEGRDLLPMSCALWAGSGTSPIGAQMVCSPGAALQGILFRTAEGTLLALSREGDLSLQLSYPWLSDTY